MVGPKGGHRTVALPLNTPLLITDLRYTTTFVYTVLSYTNGTSHESSRPCMVLVSRRLEDKKNKVLGP